MSALIRYDAACRALPEASSIDEAKDIRDRSFALKAYARQAKNKQLEIDAQRIRWRAERRLGELQTEAPKNKGALRRGSEMDPRDQTPTLQSLGIDKHLADRARKLAAVPEAEFEELLEQRPDRVEHHLKRKAREDKHKTAAARSKVVAFEDRVFSLIYADPPWRFENFGQSGKDPITTTSA